MSAVIGALRAELSASIAQFESDMGRAANAVGRFGKSAQKISQQISSAGRTMTIGITAPVIAFGIAAAKSSGDFEAAMNRVEAATGASAAELKALTDQARAFGRDRSFTATAKDSADAMETLAKNGVTVTDMMGGATKATLKLSAATGADFGDSADVATGAMQQFGKNAGQLENVVDQVTGVLLVSKFGFDDYKLAMGQAGGVAGGLGLTLEDFNTVLAATSNLFASGSDAGTSFKTFLTRMAPQSKQASEVMKQFGLNFFDATGRMKTMAQIAQMLQDKLGNLSDEAKNKALTTIFGTDAMRTAIGLMNQGADGLERIQGIISKASAQGQMDARMKGLNGQLTQLRKQLEALFLAIADSGFLSWVTQTVKGLTDLVSAVAGLPKPVLAFAAAAAAVLAILGPLALGLGGVIGLLGNYQALAGVTAAATGAIARVLGTVLGTAVGLVVRAMAPLILAFAIQFPAATAAAVTALTALRGAMAFLLGPWGLAILAIGAAVAYLVVQLLKAPKPTKELKSATDALTVATDAYEVAAGKAATATGEDAKQARIAAAAKRQLAVEARNAALAQLTQAKATLALVEAEAQRAMNQNPAFADPEAQAGRFQDMGQRQRQAQVNAKAAQAAITQADAAIARADAMMAAVAAPRAGGGRGPKDNPFVSTFGGGDGADRAKAVKAATEKFAESIRDLQDKVANGLGEKELPKSTAAAEALRRKIADISQDAKDSGVNVQAFAGHIAALRGQIEHLETVGLAKEAEKFGSEVAKSGRAVSEFERGGLTPLDDALQGVDDRFAALRDRIQDQIEANAILAEKDDAAARSMAALELQLLALDKAHQAATDAAKAQYAVEQRLADLHAQMDVASTQTDIQNLRDASGRGGFNSSVGRDLQGIQRDLDQQRLAAAEKLTELQGRLDEAQRVGDEAAISRLTTQVETQQQLLDLVGQTQAIQIQQHQVLQDSWDRLTDGLADKFGEMFAEWKFDLDGLKSVFRSWAADLASTTFKQAGSELTGMLGGFLKGKFGGGGGGGFLSSIFGGGGGAAASGGFDFTSAFAGFTGFAGGGSFKVGGMGGIDRNLVAFRARNDETVTVTRPGEGVGGGGRAVTFNVYAQDANSFRATQRQMARREKQALALK